MVLRRSLAVLLALSLALVGLGGWWWLQRQSPLQLRRQTLQMPAAARFLPRDAALSVYLQVPPDTLASYARAVAPARSRAMAAAGVDRLRDGIARAAGLDWSLDLAGWVGDDLAVALRPAGEGSGAPGWLLVLGSRRAGGGRDFLQRFWQERSLAGADLSITNHRGLGVISSDGQSLASALPSDELVLLASSRGLLEEALNASQIESLHQASDPDLQAWLASRPRGVALVRAQARERGRLLAAVQPEADCLRLHGRLRPAQPLPTAAGLPLGDSGTALAEGLQLNAPVQALLRPSLAAALDLALPAAADGGPLLPLLERGDQVTLLARLAQPPAWLAGTAADGPDPAAFDGALADAGYDGGHLDALQVWSRLSGRSGRPGQLEASLAGATGGQGNLRWWSNDLEALQRQLQRPARGSRGAGAALVGPAERVAAVALEAAPTRSLLLGWRPWQALQLAAATPLTPAVGGLEASLTPLPDAPGQLSLDGRLLWNRP